MKIGILGAGQLGRMLGLAGIPLGIQFRFWDPNQDSPANDVGEQLVADFNDLSLVEKFIKGLDLISYEFENIPTNLVENLATLLPVYPPLSALEICQDRIFEKSTFSELSIACANFRQIDSLEQLRATLESGFCLPAILKTRRMGYDGKGQVKINSIKDASNSWKQIGEAPAILEELIDFQAEFSLICVRNTKGEHAFYPLVQNTHLNGILFSSQVPSPLVSESLQLQAEAVGQKLLNHFNYVGVLTIEFFLKDGVLYANELAPRVHNSGHWTIEGSETSQFENHIRAILGLALGSTELQGHSRLLNLVGNPPPRELILKENYSHLHLYRKAGRAQRKVGHITINHSNADIVEKTASNVTQIIEPFQKFNVL
jgi:5-(carboxyamino)imidazole ribonucleotide synthase